jgi:HAD superfamily hydrolase (TIGR01509 family)
MKVIRIMLSTACAVLGVFLAGSFYSGVIARTTPQANQKPAIVFDLGGVVFKTAKSTIIKDQLGLASTVGYMLRHGCGPEGIKKNWFKILEKIRAKHEHSFALQDELGNKIAVKDEKGKVLPDYMVEWMCGNRSNEELFCEICEGIETLPKLSKADKEFMINMTRTFIPEDFAAPREAIESTVTLIKKLKKRGYPLYVLSNWDKESFNLIYKKYSDIFDLFDGYIVSGFVHMAKPDRRIYEKFEQQFPHQLYVLIDDQQDNVTMAEACGWCGIKTKTGSPNIKKIKQRIAALDDELKEKNGLHITA